MYLQHNVNYRGIVIVAILFCTLITVIYKYSTIVILASKNSYFFLHFFGLRNYKYYKFYVALHL